LSFRALGLSWFEKRASLPADSFSPCLTCGGAEGFLPVTCPYPLRFFCRSFSKVPFGFAMVFSGLSKLGKVPYATFFLASPPFAWSGGFIKRGLSAFCLFLLVGNLLIFFASSFLGGLRSNGSLEGLQNVGNFRVVDDRLWRGSAPSSEDYQVLADAGVTTIVDLRAERNLRVDEERLEQLGLVRHHVPIRDGQTPTNHQIIQVMNILRDSSGITFLHCGAGVGRTGTMTAAYLVAMGTTDAPSALRSNLEVGPPSLEQIIWAAGLRPDRVRKPPLFLVAVSRVLDAPRRMYSYIK